MTRTISTITAALAVVALTLVGCSSTGETTSPTQTAPAPATPRTQPAMTSPTQLPAGVLASISLDLYAAPAPVGVGYGSVWIGTHRANMLYRVDPSTGTVQRIDLGQSTCGPIRFGLGRVFTGWCDGSTKEMVVSPTTNQVVGSFESAEVFGVSPGAIWASGPNGDRTVRLDPKTYRVVATVPAPGIDGVVGGGFVWVADDSLDTGAYNGQIAKIDPATNKIVQHIRTRSVAAGVYMAYSGGALWLHGPGDQFLIRVDTATGRSMLVFDTDIIDLTSFSDQPLIAAMGCLWVRASSSVVDQLDGRSGELIRSYPADPQGNGGFPAVGFGSLWVANFDTGTLWRDRIT